MTLRPRARPPAAAVATVALVGLLACTRGIGIAGDPVQGGWRLACTIGIAWAFYAIAVLAVRRVEPRTAVPLVLVGAAALQLVALAASPRLTNDFYRYAWDGRVAAAGISPYRYVPTDPALSALRTAWLFPPSCAHQLPVCTTMNHPLAPTIYPPVSQLEFLAVHAITSPLGPDGGGALTWQALAAALAVATTALLVIALRRHGDPRQAVLWGWCPTVVIECAGNGHVDALAALLVLLALWASASSRPATAGALTGAAIAAKLLPVMLLPALISSLPAPRARHGEWRRWVSHRGMTLAACGVALLAAYAPYVLAAGPRVLGFLPGYLSEEGYDDGRTRFPLLRPWLPDTLAVLVGLAVLAVIAVLVARRTSPERPWAGALVLVASAFAVLGVTYPWYGLLLIVLVALDGRAAWVAIAAAAYPGYLAPALGLPYSLTNRLAYAAALAIVLTAHVRRRRRRSCAAALPERRDSSGRQRSPEQKQDSARGSD